LPRDVASDLSWHWHGPTCEEEQAFQFLWAEHLAEFDAVNHFFDMWLDDGSGELSLQPATKRQIYLRLLPAIQSLVEAQRGEGAIGGVALEENPTPKGMIRLLTVLFWQGGAFAEDWLRHSAHIQFTRQ
jgi:hypothetical protein